MKKKLIFLMLSSVFFTGSSYALEQGFQEKQNKGKTIAEANPEQAIKKINLGAKDSEKERLRLEEMNNSYFAYYFQQYTAFYYKKIEENLDSISGLLDKIYNFSAYMLDRGRVLPPVILKDNGKYKKLSEEVSQETDEQYFIKKPAKIVHTPPTWRDYLYHDFDKPMGVSNILNPKNEDEKEIIKKSRKRAQKEAQKMAIEIFNESIDRLQSDFKGITRFYFLAEQNMIEVPILSQDKVGIKIDGKLLNFNQRTFQLTHRGQFKKVKKWKPIFTMTE